MDPLTARRRALDEAFFAVPPISAAAAQAIRQLLEAADQQELAAIQGVVAEPAYEAAA